MSKSTKIIAALGVVAGLGVAALPAFTFAGSQTVSGNVDVYAQVLPAIAMTITGNNDTDSIVAETGVTHVGVNGIDVYSPASMAGGSQLDGHTLPATQTTLNSSSAVKIAPNSVIKTTYDNGTAETGDDSYFGSIVTIYTNDNGGYTLTLLDADIDNSLRMDSTHNIPAVSYTDPATSANLVAGTAAWGYQIKTQNGVELSPAADAWVAVKANNAGGTETGATIAQTAAATSGGSRNEVSYGVATAGDQTTGIYKDTIVYTATTNN